MPNPPAFWGWGKTANLLVGSLAHSGKWRAALSASTDQPHLVAALDCLVRGFGGVSRVWRFDQMATVCDPGSGRVTASFAGVAKHYGVAVAIWACHSTCVSPGWSIIGPPSGRTEGVICDEGDTVGEAG